VAAQAVRLIGDEHALDELAGRAVLASVVEIEVLERDLAPRRPPSQRQARPERDQRRHRVADRRGVRDVAAEGGRVAHLHRAVAAQQLGKGRMAPRHHPPEPRQRHPRADAQPVVLRLDPAERREAVEEHGARHLAQRLGDPERGIGRARHDRRIGVLRIPRGEAVEIDRQVGAADLLRTVPGDPREIPALVDLPVGRCGVGRGLRRTQDRRVAGAAAEVAREHVVEVAPPVAMRGVERHHEARSAEPALRAVVLDHRRLHRVEPARRRHALDRAHRPAVQLGQEEDAGVDRAVHERAVLDAGEGDRAGAAVALVASLLGAGEPPLLAQPVEQRHRGTRVLDRHRARR
jgi:hypothetical protein